MSEERRKVLEMLAAGKITTEEAERLMEKLGAGGQASEPGETERRKGGVPKYLRILVDGNGGDNVNIRIPLALVRTGIRLTTMLPSDVTRQMKEKGIDLTELSELRGNELLEALRELTVNVDGANGDTVRVFCE